MVFQRNIALYFAEIAYVCIISAKYVEMSEKIIGLTGTKKQLFNTLITTYPVKYSPVSIDRIDQVITMDSLFKYESFY